ANEEKKTIDQQQLTSFKQAWVQTKMAEVLLRELDSTEQDVSDSQERKRSPVHAVLCLAWHLTFMTASQMKETVQLVNEEKNAKVQLIICFNLLKLTKSSSLAKRPCVQP